MRKLFVVSALGLLSGCTTYGAVRSGYKVDPKAGTECKAYCQDLGMDLSAVVIMFTNTGCVCQPAGKAVSDAGNASTAAGAGAIVMQQQMQQQNKSSK